MNTPETPTGRKTTIDTQPSTDVPDVIKDETTEAATEEAAGDTADAAHTAMVGDRLYTDMAMAKRADMAGILVLSGESTAEDVEKTPDPPDFVFPSVRELHQAVCDARQ